MLLLPTGIVKEPHVALSLTAAPQKGAEGGVLASPDQGEGPECVHQNLLFQVGG